tara:strand:+ start:44 stop:982 length:939 start_codon:yes stop_codon:yes gene_type:complete
MANDYYDLTEVAKINDRNVADLDLSDILEEAPALAQMAAVTASNGTTHKWLKQTASPSVGFRSVNDGRENDHSEDTIVSSDLKILDASLSVDKSVADSYIGGSDAFLAREAARHLKTALFNAEKQIFNGTVHGDAAGFSGLADVADYNGASDAQVVDAGGTTGSTGSSVWLLRSSPDEIAVVLGENGEIAMSDPQLQRIAGSSTGFLPAYFVSVTGWITLQYASTYSAVRIANLTEDSGKGLTDDLIYEALSKFPAGKDPNVIVCNRRSAKQLRASRTATNPTGSSAPRVTEVEGIPIVVTDSILSTETLLS